MDYYLNRDIEPIKYVNDDGLVCLEEWRYVSETNNLYKVSDLGRVMSLKRKLPLILKPMFYQGYLRVDVYKHCTSSRVHRIVANTFIDNPEKKIQVNHKNHIRTDNSKNNLEWVTPLENSCHSRASRKGSSKLLGVSLHTKNRWASRIKIKGKQIRLGLFKTEEEAYEARVKYEKENGIENKYI
jgi:hypothetical protein